MMDTSETYTKQCEKAEEIQAAWVNAVDTGDVYVIRYKNGKLSHRRFSPLISGYKPIDAERAGKRAIWLPRQDQLQEMINKDSLLNLLFDFYHFVELKKAPSYSANFSSMEQLWLAFVMSEKFGKIWDGEGWVKR